MNRSLRLAGCSQPISWVSVGISRNVCWYFAECFVCISLVFVGFSRCVRHIFAIRQQHFRKPFAAVGDRFIAPAYMKTPTKWQTEMCVWWCENTYSVMWICVCGNANARIRWNEYTYSIMWICVCDETETRIWWREYTYLIMLGYGHDESAPTPSGVFATNFVGERWYFTECSPRNWQTVSSRRGPIYRARIYECTHEIGNGNAYSMKWMYIFNNVKTRVWWNGYVHLIMSGYGRDESVPYAWRGVRCAFHGLFVGILRNVRHVIGKPSAAVGADLSCPHIWKHPQNDKRKCVCGGVKTHIWWREYTYPITISLPFPPKYTSLPYTISYFAVISITLLLLLTICV